MQYVGQTGRSLKTRFREHFRKMKKPKKLDTFLYRHFKSNGHSPSKIVIQPVKKIIYTQQKKLRKSQKTMQNQNTKANNHSILFFCLDTCHRLRKMFTSVC